MEFLDYKYSLFCFQWLGCDNKTFDLISILFPLGPPKILIFLQDEYNLFTFWIYFEKRQHFLLHVDDRPLCGSSSHSPKTCTLNWQEIMKWCYAMSVLVNCVCPGTHCCLVQPCSCTDCWDRPQDPLSLCSNMKHNLYNDVICKGLFKQMTSTLVPASLGFPHLFKPNTASRCITKRSDIVSFLQRRGNW